MGGEHLIFIKNVNRRHENKRLLCNIFYLLLLSALWWSWPWDDSNMAVSRDMTIHEVAILILARTYDNLKTRSVNFSAEKYTHTIYNNNYTHTLLLLSTKEFLVFFPIYLYLNVRVEKKRTKSVIYFNNAHQTNFRFKPFF